MAYKGLFILVEGLNDKRFFDKIIKPKLKKKYDSVEVIQYANLKKEKLKRFLRSIEKMKANYLYVGDINSTSCVIKKKQKIQGKFRNIDKGKIIVVIKEIESWYLAGLNDKNSKKLRIRFLKNTEKVTKDQFKMLIPKKFDSEIDFRLEILKFFSIETAKQKNKSFKYFVNKML